MALKKPIAFLGDRGVRLSTGIEILEASGVSVQFPRAYIRVEAIEGDKTTQRAHIACYTEKGGALLWRKPVGGLPVSLDGGNNIEQAYLELKKLLEFADAEDA
jgi:hypothetical protein